MWRASPLCLFWTVWQERNRRVFEALELPEHAIKLSFISTFLKWVRSYVEDYSMTMIDFVDWINSK